jgi:predicted mannosyl-3-phosphoglycerate phosphatase (HAD superfamily)
LDKVLIDTNLENWEACPKVVTELKEKNVLVLESISKVMFHKLNPI